MALRELLMMFGMDVDKNDENRVKGTMDKLKMAATAVAGVWATIKSGEVIAGMVMETAELGDEVNRTSEKLGVSADSLQELRFAAEQVSISQEDLGTSFRVLGKQAAAAAEGSKGALDAFKDLGISAKDLKNGDGSLKTVDQLLRQVADGMGSVTDPTKKAAVASELLGRSGANLIPMLSGGSAGLDDMAASAHELGYVLDGETLEAAAKMDDASDYLTAALKGLHNTFGAQLLPVFTDGVKIMGQLAKASVPLVKIFAKVLLGAFKLLTSLVKGVIIGFNTLEKTFGKFGDVLGVVGVALIGLGAAFGIVGQAATFAALKAAAAWIVATAPLLLTILAIGLIGAALFFLVDEFVTMGEGGETVIGDLINYFTELVDELGGIGGAIKEIFFNAFEAIFGMSRDTFDSIYDGIVDWGGAILAPVIAAVDLITNIFATLMQFIDEVFTGSVSDAFSHLWDNVKNTATQFIDDIMKLLQKAIGPIKAIASALNPFGDEKEAAGFDAAGKNALGQLDPFNKSAMSGASKMEGALSGNPQNDVAAMAASNAPVSNSTVVAPQTKVEVHVDASGNANPQAVGTAVGQSIDGVIERQNRQTLDAFAVSAS